MIDSIKEMEAKCSYKIEIDKIINSRSNVSKAKLQNILPFVDFIKMERYFLSKDIENIIKDYDKRDNKDSFKAIVNELIKKKELF